MNLWFAVPVILLIALCIIIMHKRFPAQKVSISGRHLILLFSVALLSIILSEFTAITSHLPQGSDFSVRNAVYESLVACDWPLYTEDGSFFVYYLGFWLPPALIAKLLPSNYMWWILEGWVCLGFFLMGALLVLKRGFKALIFLLFLLTMKDAISFYSFIHSHILPLFQTESELLFNLDQSLLRNLSFSLFYPHPFGNYINSYHLVIPSWCVLTLLLTEAVERKHYLLISAFLFICSPLSSIALFIFLIFVLFKDKNFRTNLINGHTITAVLFLIPLVLYFPLNESGIVTCTCLHFGSKKVFCLSVLANIIFILLPAFIILKGKRSTPLFLAFVSIFILIQMIWIGANHANELLYKGSCVMWFLLAWLYSSSSANKTCRVLKYSFLCVLLVSFVSELRWRIHNYSLDETTMQSYVSNTLNGHFNHDADAPYCFQFKGKKPPCLFYQAPGEAANGVLKPFATGIRPDCFKGLQPKSS